MHVPCSLLIAGSGLRYYEDPKEVGVTTQVRLAIADELFRYLSDGYRDELVNGKLEKLAPAGNEHGMLTLDLTARSAATKPFVARWAKEGGSLVLGGGSRRRCGLSAAVPDETKGGALGRRQSLPERGAADPRPGRAGGPPRAARP